MNKNSTHYCMHRFRIVSGGGGVTLFAWGGGVMAHWHLKRLIIHENKYLGVWEFIKHSINDLLYMYNMHKVNSLTIHVQYKDLNKHKQSYEYRHFTSTKLS